MQAEKKILHKWTYDIDIRWKIEGNIDKTSQTGIIMIDQR